MCHLINVLPEGQVRLDLIDRSRWGQMVQNTNNTISYSAITRVITVLLPEGKGAELFAESLRTHMHGFHSNSNVNSTGACMNFWQPSRFYMQQVITILVITHCLCRVITN